MRKSLFFAVFIIALSMAGLAQNDKISYQAVVRNSANQLVYDQDLNVTVGIANSETGTAVYTETHAVHSNANGLISLLIGNGTPVAGSNWDAIQWNHAWVTAVVSQGGTELATHHLPLSAVPYALYADQVDPVALANYLTANHYLTEETQVLSISHDTVFLTGGSFVKLPAGFSGDYNDLTNLPDLTQYATNAHLNDTLGHYATTSALKDSLTRYVDKEKLNDTLDHYLMQEVQVLSVSNDTLYLTGGSWVKLPQGFSGDYNDLTNLPDLTQYATNTHLNDTLGHYYTSNEVNDTLAYYATTSALKDSLTHYVDKEKLNDTLSHYLMQEVQVLSVSNDTLYLTGGSWVKLPQGFSGDYNDLTNLPDLTQYVTNTHLNDTLGHYYTSNEVNDTLAYYATTSALKDSLTRYVGKEKLNDTLSHYLMQEVQVLSVSNDTLYLTGGSWVKLPQGFSGDYNDLTNLPDLTQYATNAHLNDTLSLYPTLQTLKDTAANVRSALVDTAAAIRGNFPAVNDGQLTIITKGDTTRFTANQAGNDTVNLSGFVTTAQLNDTLNAYYTKGQVKDTLMNFARKDTLVNFARKDTLVNFARKDTLVNFARKDTLVNFARKDTLVNFARKDTLVNFATKDTLNAYYDTTRMKKAIHDTANVLRGEFPTVNDGQITIKVNNQGVLEENTFGVNQANDQTINITIPQNVAVNDGQLTIITKGDTTRFTANQSGNDTVNLSGFVTTAHLNDTLNAYYTKGQVKDTLVNFARKDTLVNFARKDTLVNFARKDTLVNFARKDTLVNFARKDTLVNFARKDTLVNFARKDTLVNFARKDTLVNFARKDTLVNFARKDTLVNFARKDTLVNFARKDTLVNFARKDTLVNFARKDTLVNFARKDTLVNFARKDTLVNFARKDTLVNFARKDTLVNFARKDTLVNFARKDTLVNFARKDTLVNFARKDTLVNFARKDTLVNFARKDTLVNFARKDTLVNFARKDTLVNFARKDTLVNFARKDTLVNFARKDTLVNFARKDTLVNFARKDTLVNFARKDTLVNFARKDTLVNFARKDTLVNFARKDTLVNFARKDTLVNFARKDTLVNFARKDTLVNFATKDTLNAYYDTTRMKKAIHDTADVLRGEFPVVNDARITIAVNRSATTTETTVTNPTFGVNQANPQTVIITIPQETTVNNGQLTIVAAGDTTRFTANQATNDTMRLNKFATKDTLKNFVNKLAIRDSVNNIVKDSLAAPNSAINLAIDTIARHNISDSTRMVFDTLHKYYATKDTLKNFVNKLAIRDSVNNIVKDSLAAPNSAINLAIDTIARHNISDSTRMVFDTLHKYYATKDTLKNFVNKLAIRDSVNNVVKDSLAAPNSAINLAIDTIARHNISDSTRMVFDTLHKYYATKDTLKNFVNKLAIRDSVNNIVKDSLAAPNSAINLAIDTIARHNISDSTRMVFDTLHKYYATKDTLKNFVNKLAIRDSVNNVVKDSLAAPNSAINLAIDTIARHNISDSTRMVFDTLHKYYATKDTLKNFVNKLAIRDSVNNIVKDSLAAPNSAINLAIDTIARHNISDSTRMVFDTLHKYYATKDTLKNFVNKLAIRDSVNNIVKDSLAAPNSAINLAIDTIARHNISDSTRMVFDTLHKYYATKDTLKNFVNKLAIRDSVNNVVKDSLAAPNSAINLAIDTIARHNISDSTRMVFDTLHKYYATKDTLKNFVNKLAIRDSVNNIVKDSLAAPNSAINLAIDTIARHNISDSTRMVFDTLHKYYATKDTLKNFVNKLAIRDSVNNIVKDSLAAPNSAINKAIDTIARHNIHDTAMVIRNSIGNGQITIQKNGVVITDGTQNTGSFKLNQKTDQTINIEVPTKTSELTNDSHFAQKTGDTYSNTHDFTGATITVPSNIDAIKRPTMTPPTTCDNMNAVNVCDLLAVFDSLTKRIDALQQELDELKSSTPPVFNSLTFSDITSTTMKVITQFTSQTTPITSYKFCYSTNSDMSSPTCVDTTASEITLKGLNPFQRYYITVTASNIAGSTTGSGNERTFADKPEASTIETTPSPRGFEITVSNLHFNGPSEGTIQVLYKQGTDCAEDEEGFTAVSNPIEMVNGSTYYRRVTNLEAETPYCVLVKLSNEDSTKVYSLNVVSGSALSLSIEIDTVSTVSICENDTVVITFTAKLNYSEYKNDYNYQFVYSTSQSAQRVRYISRTDSSFKMAFFTQPNRTTYECTITANAVHKTYGSEDNLRADSVITVNKITHPTFTICNDRQIINFTRMDEGVTTVAWGDGATDNNPSVASSHLYDAPGFYNLEVSRGSCTTTKRISVNQNLTPCIVSSPHIDNSEYTSETGGLEVAVDDTVYSVNDQDGHSYQVTQIGTQCWMKSNLRTTKLSDGTNLSYGTDESNGNLTLDAAVKYYYKPTAAHTNTNYNFDYSRYNEERDGLYYNWTAAMNGAGSSNSVPSNVQGICPKGWHMPSRAEWDVLIDYAETTYGTSTGYANQLSGGCEWEPINEQVNSEGNPGYYANANRNITGFSALPAGCIDYPSTFINNTTSGARATFWTTETGGTFNRPYVKIFYNIHNYVGEECSATANKAMSVRCLRDADGPVTPTTSCAVTNVGTNEEAGENNTITAVRDVQNHEYSVVEIGGLCWMKENLRSTQYSSNLTGTPPTLALTTGSTSGGAYYAYPGNDSGNEGTYGLLYNWQAVMGGSTAEKTQGICPDGWHVPSRGEIIQINVGGVTAGMFAGGESGTWTQSDVTAAPGNYSYSERNSTGFSALPAGYHENNWPNQAFHELALFWTSTMSSSNDAYALDLAYNLSGITPSSQIQTSCLSVRCVRNAESVVPTSSCAVTTPAANEVPGENNTITAVKDAELNSYSVVQVGTQCWMAENLRSTNYDGTSSTAITGIYPPDGDEDNVVDFGYLYNWGAVMNGSTIEGIQGICPSGWHVPDSSEITTLSNTGVVSEYPGKRKPNNTYSDFGSNAFFWSSTDNLYDEGYPFGFDLNQNQLTSISQTYGFSVRCVRNEGGGSTSQTDPTVTTGAATSITDATATLGASITNPDGVTITAKGFVYKETTGTTWTSVAGTGEGDTIIANLTGLTDNTEYTYKAFITFEGGIDTVWGVVSKTFTTDEAAPVSGGPCPGIPTVTDASGITYNTVLIGSQCWMKENLRTTKYSDNTDITTYYDYSSSGIPLERRGYLYDWNVVVNQSGDHDICPAGWHLPSKSEWRSLVDFLGSHDEYICDNDPDYIAKALAATTDWAQSSDECDPGYMQGNNSSGFSAVPAGYYTGDYEDATYFFYFWTSSYDDLNDEGSGIMQWGSQVYFDSYNVDYGLSVRCVRGEVTTSSATNISTTGAWLRGSVYIRGNAVTEKGFYWKATEGGTYTKVTITGETLTYRLGGLTANTSYTYYAFASTAAGTVYGDEVEFTTSSEFSVSNCGTVTDMDGNTYNTVIIGTQCWLKENLRTVGNLPSFENVSVSSDPFYYQPTTSDFAEYNVSTYGLYYNRSAALNNYNGSGIENPTNHIQGICPTGWHIPSKSEWQTLKVTTSSSPCKLAESSDWNGNDWGEDDVSPGNYGYPYRNQTGFSALPSGRFDASSGAMDGTYPPHSHALFWSSSFDNDATYYLRLWYYDTPFYFETCDNNYAFPVRCVRDSE